MGSPAGTPIPVPPRAVIAIDGPAGSGKSSTARALAARLGLLYVDTGAMYRALTWAGLAAGLAPADGAAWAGLLRRGRLELRPGDSEARVLWDGRDVSDLVRTPAVEAAVSAVSAHAEVRALMVARQRELGRAGGVVMEGRDIGSVVFPLATAKLYLDATPAARAARRVRQFRERGRTVDPAAVEAELAARDRHDSERSVSPLTIALDAAVLETSAWSLAEQIDRAEAAVRAIVAESAPCPPAPDSPAGRIDGRYRFAYRLLAAFGRFHGVRVVGREHLDLPGGVLIAANHVSWWDPPILAGTVWRGRAHVIAKAELFRPAPWGAFLRAYGTIPIRRSGFDASAFGAALAALARGEDVALFPEGTRRPVGRPGPLKSALGILIQKSEAPTVPVFLRGTRVLQPGGSALAPLEVRYGPAVRPRALPALRARHDDREITRRIGLQFLAIFEELQARSWAERPLTDWEREDGERMAARVAARDARVFRRRPPQA